MTPPGYGRPNRVGALVDVALLGTAMWSMQILIVGAAAFGAVRDNELIRAVVAEGAAARNAADEAWLSDRYGLRGALQEQVERLQDWFTDLLTSASVPTTLRGAVEASGATRYLLIAAGDDPDETHAAMHVAAGAPDRVAVWTLPDVGHSGGLAGAREEWTSRVISFLSEVLDDGSLT